MWEEKQDMVDKYPHLFPTFIESASCRDPPLLISFP